MSLLKNDFIKFAFVFVSSNDVCIICCFFGGQGRQNVDGVGKDRSNLD